MNISFSLFVGTFLFLLTPHIQFDIYEESGNNYSLQEIHKTNNFLIYFAPELQ